MKIKHTRFKRYKLLKSYLLILQTYLKKLSNTNLNLFLDKNIEITEVHLKTALKIIHEFHYNKRKILFIGTDCIKKSPLSKALKLTKHTSIKSENWIPGIFKNSFVFLQQASVANTRKISQKNKMYSKKIKMSLNLLKQPDIIIILGLKLDQGILNEIYKLNIPVISFNNNISELKDFSTHNYQIEGNFSQLKTQNLGNLIVSSVLKPVK